MLELLLERLVVLLGVVKNEVRYTLKITILGQLPVASSKNCNLPVSSNPSCRHDTIASRLSNRSLHTLPHSPPRKISTRPRMELPKIIVSSNRIAPSAAMVGLLDGTSDVVGSAEVEGSIEPDRPREEVSDGARVGMSEGISEGIVDSDGCRVGTVVGTLVGFSEGATDGMRVGKLEGELVGICVGEREGTVVGISEGVTDGDCVGASEGDAEGI